MGSIGEGDVMRYIRASSKCNQIWPLLMVSLFVASILVIKPSESLQIPDQQAIFDKFFYYQLPITEQELRDIKHIHITEASSGSSLPSWLQFKRIAHKWLLLGIPSHEHRGLHFFHLKIIKSNDERKDDVFVIDVVDSSNSAPNPLIHQLDHRKECILRITPTFGSIIDVWDVISYLVPAKIQEESDFLNNYQRSKISETNENVNTLIQNWIRTYFNPTRIIGNDADARYQITIEHQDCDSNNNKKYSDDFVTKLRKLGLDFNLIKIIKSVPLFDDTHEAFEEDNFERNFLTATKVWHDNDVTQNRDFRRHKRRHLDPIYATPVLAPDWMTLSSSTIQDYEDGVKEKDGGPLTRVIPTLSSPSAPVASVDIISASFSSQVTDLHPHRHHHTKYTPFIYSTPILSPEPPTDINEIESMLSPSPTPTLTFKITATTKDPEEDEFEGENNVKHLTPTATFTGDLSTVTPDSPVTITTHRPTTEKPEFGKAALPNSSPKVLDIIDKKSLIAGKYWKYEIPDRAFKDMEDGFTKSLKLGFFVETSSPSKKEPPRPDFWIQFDHENQILSAFPTEENIGKYYFYLMAVDSDGESVTEKLEIHVRQHPSSRTFHHTFTLQRVTWKNTKHLLLIDAIESFANIICNRVFGDTDTSSFTVLSVEKDGFSNNAEDEIYTISWTNDSLPVYPCPREEIHRLYSKLADKSKTPADGVSVPPSRILNKILGNEFTVKGVGLRLQANCGEAPSTEGPGGKGKMLLRNPVEHVAFNLGEVIKYSINKEMFYSEGSKKSTRQLELNLLTINGHLPRNGFIGFNVERQMIYGLALSPENVGSQEYQLLATDPDTKASERDAFIIEIVDPGPIDHTFEITMSLLPDSANELDLESKVQLSWRITTIILNDADPSSLKVLEIRKKVYVPHNRVGRDKPYNSTYEDEEDIPYRKKPKESMIEEHFGRRVVRESSPQYYYEFVWTNKTKLLTSSSNCPSEPINDNIINRMFVYQAYERLEEKFAPDYHLLHVEFKPVGRCDGYFTVRELGNRPRVAPIAPPPPPDRFPTTKEPSIVTPFSNEIDELNEKDVYISTILPAVVTITIMLLISCILVICLIKYKRSQDKTRFDVLNASRGIASDPGFTSERDAFLAKGRTPVIFESELQHHQPLSQPQQQSYNLVTPVIMPPTPKQQQHQMQQMTPMRQLSKPTYQPLPNQPTTPAHQQQRRQPPPYYK